MTPELKPCPFCGSSAAYGYVDDESRPDFGGHYIQCDKCHASTHLRYASGGDPKPHLADAWNTRPSERQARDEALEGAAHKADTEFGKELTTGLRVATWLRALKSEAEGE